MIICNISLFHSSDSLKLNPEKQAARRLLDGTVPEHPATSKQSRKRFTFQMKNIGEPDEPLRAHKLPRS
jgi:hypothetical protein